MNYTYEIAFIIISAIFTIWLISAGNPNKPQQKIVTETNHQKVIHPPYYPYLGPSPDLIHYMRYRKAKGCIFGLMLITIIVLIFLIWLKLVW